MKRIQRAWHVSSSQKLNFDSSFLQAIMQKMLIHLKVQAQVQQSEPISLSDNFHNYTCCTRSAAQPAFSNVSRFTAAMPRMGFLVARRHGRRAFAIENFGPCNRNTTKETFTRHTQ